LPNVGPYIYDVSISGFTRSSIYIYDISSLRVKLFQPSATFTPIISKDAKWAHSLSLCHRNSACIPHLDHLSCLPNSA